MIYKAYYCVFECEDEKDAEKWVKSIKLCKANIADYEHELIEDDEGFGAELDRFRYATMDNYHRVTSRSVFSDFELLVEAHEQKTMFQIFLHCELIMESKRSKPVFYAHLKKGESKDDVTDLKKFRIMNSRW